MRRKRKGRIFVMPPTNVTRAFQFLSCLVWQATPKLPRSQQEKIAAVIEAFVNQHSDREV
jgi:hypothetical protein